MSKFVLCEHAFDYHSYPIKNIIYIIFSNLPHQPHTSFIHQLPPYSPVQARKPSHTPLLRQVKVEGPPTKPSAHVALQRAPSVVLTQAARPFGSLGTSGPQLMAGEGSVCVCVCVCVCVR